VGVRLFRSTDQSEARSLVLQGLGEHFGFIDETLNPDLDDIGASFADGVFLVAERDGQIVGTGGLLAVDNATARIVRMSTRASIRRHHVGTAILSRLIEEARARAFARLVLARNAEWDDAVAFYKASGFAQIEGPAGAASFLMTVDG
jgi:GNAT superfamily N-acetyltransferase